MTGGQTPAAPGAPLGVPAEAAELLDARLRADLLASVDVGQGRAVVVGCGWPGLPLALAERGVFVSVVAAAGPDVARLRDQILAAGLGPRVRLDPRPYRDVAFEASSFDLVVAYDGIPSDEAAAFFKKCRRDLRTGGQAVVRVNVSRAPVLPDAAAGGGLVVAALDVPAPDPATERWLMLRNRVLAGAYRAATRLGLFAPEAAALVRDARLGPLASPPDTWDVVHQGLQTYLVLERVQAYHLARVDLVAFAAGLRPPLGRLVRDALLPLAERLEGPLLRRPATRPFARTLVIYARKQLELGRVFMSHVRR